ncbi:MAG: thrombospondin type 3 repeat-containing protein [Gammaproteobacteria bacterium]
MNTKKGLLVSALTLLLWSPMAFAQDVFDSDGDGIDDNNDNCTLTANADQTDSDGDFMGNACDGDFNNDGSINVIDLGMLRAAFFTSDVITDLNADGTTNVVDLGLLRAMYFATPGPTGTDPAQPPCTCYFSNDCPSGTFCDYGPGSFSTEDICVWRDIKPDGVVGAGCSIESDLGTGAWTPDICDGVCAEAVNGSSIGLENTELIAQAVEQWGTAMISPSAAGGGPVDEAIANDTLAMPFTGLNVPLMLGRQAADALAMAAGEPFHYYFCHYEGHPESEDPPVVNLAGDSCRIASGEITIRALAETIRKPGSAAKIMPQIQQACPGKWQELFVTQCEAGPGAMACAIQYIEAQAHFLRTPQVADLAVGEPIEELLRQAQR